MNWNRLFAGLSFIIGLYYLAIAKRSGGLIGIGFALVLVALTPAGYGIIQERSQQTFLAILGITLIGIGVALDAGIREALFETDEPPPFEP